MITVLLLPHSYTNKFCQSTPEMYTMLVSTSATLSIKCYGVSLAPQHNRGAQIGLNSDAYSKLEPSDTEDNY